MAIRITDSVKPGYARINLDLIGKSGPPESTGKVGSAVLNQAQADVLRMKSSASTPPSVSPANWVQRSRPLFNNGRPRSTFSGVGFLPQYDISGGSYPKTLIAYGNGVYVMFGMNRSIGPTTAAAFRKVWISADAINWSVACTLPLTGATDYPDPYNQLIFANGLFVAVGGDPVADAGCILTSPDGITWTKRSAVSSYNLIGVAYGNGKFVAVAKGGVGTSVLTSTDGITWAWQTTTGMTGTPNFRTFIVFINGYFYASNGDNSTIARSANGLAWTEYASYFPYGLAGNGTSLLVGMGASPSRSTDAGLTWSSPAANPAGADRLYSMAYGNGLFVGIHGINNPAESGTIYTSPDGLTWTKRSVPVSDWSSIVFANGMFLLTSTDAPQVMTSTDGITWVQRLNTPRGYTAITYGNGLYVAVSNTGGNQRVITSPDGLVWTPRTTPLDDMGDAWWSAICWSGSLFVALATFSGDYSQKIVMTSPDGVTWTMQTVPNSTGYYFESIAFGGGMFIALARGYTNYLTSVNGTAWLARTGIVAHQWSGIAYGNGRFVAVSQNGKANTTTDGVTWTGVVQIGATPHTWYSVTFGNGLFVASGYGYMAYSSDGISWAVVAVTGEWRAVAFCGNVYCAVGPNVGGQCVATSTDGAVWTKGTTQANPNRWCGVAGDGGDKAVAVADDCTANATYPIMTARADGAAVSARYWRFAGTGYSIAYEIEIKDAAGTNRARASAGATVTASDFLQAGTEPSKAIDGLIGGDAGWKSLNTGGVHWIEIDLGQVRDIASVKVTPRDFDDGLLGWETNPIVITAGNTPAPATVVKTLVPRIDFPYGTVAPIVAALSDTSTT